MYIYTHYNQDGSQINMEGFDHFLDTFEKSKPTSARIIATVPVSLNISLWNNEETKEEDFVLGDMPDMWDTVISNLKHLRMNARDFDKCVKEAKASPIKGYILKVIKNFRNVEIFKSSTFSEITAMMKRYANMCEIGDEIHHVSFAISLQLDYKKNICSALLNLGQLVIDNLKKLIPVILSGYFVPYLTSSTEKERIKTITKIAAPVVGSLSGFNSFVNSATQILYSPQLISPLFMTQYLYGKEPKDGVGEPQTAKLVKDMSNADWFVDYIYYDWMYGDSNYLYMCLPYISLSHNKLDSHQRKAIKASCNTQLVPDDAYSLSRTIKFETSAYGVDECYDDKELETRLQMVSDKFRKKMVHHRYKHRKNKPKED